MNLENAYTEPFARFMEFENRFDDEFKIAEAAMSHLARTVTGPGGPTIMQGLMMDVADLYREQEVWNDPVGKLTRARASANLLGIVQVHSAIDDFLVQLEAERDRWLALTDQEPAAPGGKDDEENADEEDEPPPKDKIERVCEKLGLPVDGLLPVKPLLRAYRGIRNCVAHRSGIATAAVADLVASPEVAGALTAWPAPRRDDAPALTLPTVTFGEVVRVEPRQVIFCLSLAHRALASANAAFIARIGADGFVRLAARHSLLGGGRTGRNGSHRSAVLDDILSSRYKATNVTAEETVRTLRGANLWTRCLEGYRRVYGAPRA